MRAYFPLQSHSRGYGYCQAGSQKEAAYPPGGVNTVEIPACSQIAAQSQSKRYQALVAAAYGIVGYAAKAFEGEYGGSGQHSCQQSHHGHGYQAVRSGSITSGVSHIITVYA